MPVTCQLPMITRERWQQYQQPVEFEFVSAPTAKLTLLVLLMLLVLLELLELLVQLGLPAHTGLLGLRLKLKLEHAARD